MTQQAEQLWKLVRAGDPDARCRAAEALLTLHGIKVAERDRHCDLLGGLKSGDHEMVGLATHALETLIAQLQSCRKR